MCAGVCVYNSIHSHIPFNPAHHHFPFWSVPCFETSFLFQSTSARYLQAALWQQPSIDSTSMKMAGGPRKALKSRHETLALIIGYDKITMVWQGMYIYIYIIGFAKTWDMRYVRTKFEYVHERYAMCIRKHASTYQRLPICLPVYLHVYPCMYPPTYLSTCLLINLSIYN